MHDSLYREIILEHWKKPLNYGILSDAQIDISSENPLCGDSIRITANIIHMSISEIKFTSEGCAISKASASIFTELIINKSVSEIKKITKKSFLNEIGIMLTPAREKCALLAYSTLIKALDK